MAGGDGTGGAMAQSQMGQGSGGQEGQMARGGRGWQRVGGPDGSCWVVGQEEGGGAEGPYGRGW